ncbi:Deleted in lung and esophageal cancer protein 1, partial [Quaeritorhiza haematococci]
MDTPTTARQDPSPIPMINLSNTPQSVMGPSPTDTIKPPHDQHHPLPTSAPEIISPESTSILTSTQLPALPTLPTKPSTLHQKVSWDRLDLPNRASNLLGVLPFDRRRLSAAPNLGGGTPSHVSDLLGETPRWKSLDAVLPSMRGDGEVFLPGKGRSPLRGEVGGGGEGNGNDQAETREGRRGISAGSSKGGTTMTRGSSAVTKGSELRGEDNGGAEMGVRLEEHSLRSLHRSAFGAEDGNVGNGYRSILGGSVEAGGVGVLLKGALKDVRDPLNSNLQKDDGGQSGRGKERKAKGSKRKDGGGHEQIARSPSKAKGSSFSLRGQSVDNFAGIGSGSRHSLAMGSRNSLLGGSQPHLSSNLSLTDDDDLEGIFEAITAAAASELETEEVGDHLRAIQEERDKKLGTLRGLKDFLLGARDRAKAGDEARDQQDVEAFGASLEEIGLPLVRAPMQVDDPAFIKAHGLAPIPTDIDLEEDKEQRMVGLPSAQMVEQFRMSTKLPRTSNGLSKTWRKTRNMFDEIEHGSVLEVDLSAAAAADPPDVRKAGKSKHSKTRRKRRHQTVKDANFSETRTVSSQDVQFSEKQREGQERHTQQHFPVLADPPQIMFNEYEAFHTYEKKLILKNISGHSLRFRILNHPDCGKSDYFTLATTAAGGQNSKEGGGEAGRRVAPGMSCDYRITFNPDSHGQFSHTYLVQIETGQSFCVHVTGRRDPPVLTLPLTLDVGPCRAGGRLLRTWEFVNKGGDARFLVVRDDEGGSDSGIGSRALPDVWNQGEESVKSVNDFVICGPFVISPRFMALKKGQTGQVSVLYAPPEIAARDVTDAPVIPNEEAVVEEGKNPECNETDQGFRERVDCERIKLICDNMEETHMSLLGVAQKPHVSIVKVVRHDDDSTSLKNDEVVALVDVSTLVGDHHVLDFGPQNPTASSKATVTICNNTSLHLPIRWFAYDYPGDREHSIPKEVLKDEEERRTRGHVGCVVEVSPAVSSLPPLTEKPFEFVFSPMLLGPCDVAASLVLLAPDAETESRIAAFTKKISLEHVAEGRNEDDSDGVQKQLLLRMRCVGECVPHDVSMDPSFLIVPGILPLGGVYTAEVRILNRSVSAVKLEFSAEGEDSQGLTLSPGILQIDLDIVRGDVSNEKTTCTIPSMSYVTATLNITGIYPGKATSFLVCRVAGGGGKTVILPIRAEIEILPNALTFGDTFLDLGVVRLGLAATATVPLTNSTGVPIRWRIEAFVAEETTPAFVASKEEGGVAIVPAAGYGNQYRYKPGTEDNEWCIIRCEPKRGVIDPYSTVVIKIVAWPLWYQRLRAILECRIFGTRGVEREGTDGLVVDSTEEIEGMDVVLHSGVPASSIEIRGEVQTPVARLLTQTENVANDEALEHGHRPTILCYAGVPLKTKMYIKNLTHLDTRFQFVDLEILGGEKRNEEEGKKSNDVAVDFGVHPPSTIPTGPISTTPTTHPSRPTSLFVTCSPTEGPLPSGQTIEVDIEIRCWEKGRFLGLPLVRCRIDKMVEGRGLLVRQFDLDVRGFEVEVEVGNGGVGGSVALATTAKLLDEERTRIGQIPQEVGGEMQAVDVAQSTAGTDPSSCRIAPAVTSKRLDMDFGTCAVYDVHQRTLIIRNKSGMPVPFSMIVQKHPAVPARDGDEEEDVGDGLCPQKDKERGKKDHLVPNRNATTTSAHRQATTSATMATGTATATSPKKSPLKLQPTTHPQRGFKSSSGREYMRQINVVRHRISKMRKILGGNGLATNAGVSAPETFGVVHRAGSFGGGVGGGVGCFGDEDMIVVAGVAFQPEPANGVLEPFGE